MSNKLNKKPVKTIEAKPLNKLKLLSDQALCETQEHRQDGLGFDKYADIIAASAIGTPGPFTIGVFGEWGTGKTSLMRLVEQKLSNSKEDVVVVWYNAWMYEKEEHPIVSLVATIIKALDANKSFLDKIQPGGKSIIRALRAVAYGFSSKSKVKIPGFAEIEASFVAKDMIERDEALRKDPLLDRSLYYEAFEQLSNVNLNSNQRVVILIDDLDRCFPDQAIRLLESIKLVLNQRGFIFVLGVARKVIEGYLQHRYKNEFGIDGTEGSRYLDKIVQLSFHIPPHKTRMKSLCSELLKQVSSSDNAKLTPLIPLIENACECHPRAAVRFINNLILDKAISEACSINIDMAFFLITRSLQNRWNEVFSILTTSDDLCNNIAGWNFKSIPPDGDLEPDEIKLSSTLRDDSELLMVLSSQEGRMWLKDHNSRNAAIDFLATQRNAGTKIRVSSLAENLGISNSEVLNRLRELGVDAKTVTSLVDAKVADKINFSDNVRVTTNIISRRAAKSNDCTE